MSEGGGGGIRLEKPFLEPFSRFAITENPLLLLVVTLSWSLFLVDIGVAVVERPSPFEMTLNLVPIFVGFKHRTNEIGFGIPIPDLSVVGFEHLLPPLLFVATTAAARINVINTFSS